MFTLEQMQEVFHKLTIAEAKVKELEEEVSFYKTESSNARELINELSETVNELSVTNRKLHEELHEKHGKAF